MMVLVEYLLGESMDKSKSCNQMRGPSKELPTNATGTEKPTLKVIKAGQRDSA
jgi:hypothetical protein